MSLLNETTENPQSYPRVVRWMTIVGASIHVLLVSWAIVGLSPAYDEWGHLPSGWCHIVSGRYEPYRVNPPIPRMIAACGAGMIGFSPPLRSYFDGANDRPEWLFAADMSDYYRENVDRFFVAGRFALFPFSLAGLACAWRWSVELYGAMGGLISLWVWGFFPLMIAYEGMLVPDAFASSVSLIASYAFWKFTRSGHWVAGLVASFFLGLAVLSKMTLLVMVPIWFCWIMMFSPAHRRWHRLAIGLAILSGALLTVNGGYGFADTCLSIASYDFTSLQFRRWQDLTAATEGSLEIWGRIPVPLPREFLRGVDMQASDFEKKLPSYWMGRWANHGWLAYYAIGLCVKSPVIALLMLVGSCVVGSRLRREEWWLLCLPVVLLVFVSAQTGFNHHVRYVLPILPPMFVFMGRIATVCKTPIRRRWLVGCLLVYPWSCMSVAPCHYAYFNQLSGGSNEGWRWMGDSNIDWGQDLALLRNWAHQHPECRPLYVAYSIPFRSPESFEFPCQSARLDADGEPMNRGWYAIFADRLIRDMRTFQDRTPRWRPSPALLIFDLSGTKSVGAQETSHQGTNRHE